MCQVVVLTEMVFWSLWIVMMHVSANFPGTKVIAVSSFKFLVHECLCLSITLDASRI